MEVHLLVSVGQDARILSLPQPGNCQVWMKGTRLFCEARLGRFFFESRVQLRKPCGLVSDADPQDTRLSVGWKNSGLFKAN